MPTLDQMQTDRRADSGYPSDDELVALMREHGSFSKVARAVGRRRESLRDFLRIRPELDARMREHVRDLLTPEEREKRQRRASREYQRRMRVENPERVRQLRRESARRMDPELRRRSNHYNRLRRQGMVIPNEESDEYALILSTDPCAYCGGEMEHLDHIVPIADGGDGRWDNLTAACGGCNCRKKARSLLVFMLAEAA